MRKYLLIEPSTLRLRLKTLKPLLQAGKGYKTGEIVWRDSYGEEYLSLTAHYYTEYPADSTGYVIGLRWRTPDGRTGEQDICLTYKESNLGKGRVWYFVCNYTEHPCRTLYFCRDQFYSRWALPTRYDYQNMSRAQRGERFTYNDIPDLDRRKYYYRDKLTPIGRRYERLNEKAKQSESLFLSRLSGGGRRRR